MSGVKMESTVDYDHSARRASNVDPIIPQDVGWLERKIKPTKITARYPFKGKMLLYTTCAFGSLGDALFGYNSGIMSGLLVNPVFVAKFYSAYGGGNGSISGVNSSITGISVSSLQLTAAIGALVAGRLGDMIG